MEFTPKTLLAVAAAAMVAIGAAWQWGPVLLAKVKSVFPNKENQPPERKIHSSVDAYNFLFDAVDSPTQKVLYDKVWPALARRPEAE